MPSNVLTKEHPGREKLTQPPKPEQQFVGQAISVSLSDGNSHISPRLTPGRYIITCPDGDIYVRQGGANISASTNDFVLYQKGYIEDVLVTGVDDSDNYFAFVRGSATSMTVKITRTDQV